MSKVKITDVATYAGVSVSTVSLALSGKGRISESTVEKVNKAIKHLGYVRNKAAANLRSHTSNLIGLVLRDITDPYYMSITSGLTDILEQQGYMLFLAQSGADREKQLNCVQSMIQQNVAGIIYSPVRGASDHCLDIINQANIPSINIARASINTETNYIGPDNTQAATLATKHLIEQGHRHIAYIGGHSESLTRAERIGGYCSTLIQYGLPFKNEWIIECHNHQEASAIIVEKLLKSYPKITAILCHYPATAIGAIYGTKTSNKSIGNDNYIGQEVALIGFDDTSETKLTSPPLTVVSTSPLEIGSQAARQILHQIQHPNIKTQRSIIAPKMIIRGSA